MSLAEALRLLRSRWPWLLLLPLTLAAATFFFARRRPLAYASDTTLYTGIASGYSLTGNAEADYNQINNAYDNITNLATARATKTEALLRLLAMTLWRGRQQPAAPGGEVLPAALRQRLAGPDSAATLLAVRRYAQASDTNRVARLLAAPAGPYALASLDKLTAKRLNSSDLLRLEYESDSPERSRTTLQLLTQVLLEQEQTLHSGQTAPVVAFYDQEVARTKARLDQAEQAYATFARDNGIINYDEQTRNLTGEKERLAAALTDADQQVAGARAALAAVRQRLGSQPNALQASQELIAQRQQLSGLNTSIANAQLFGAQQEQGSSPARVAELQAEAGRAGEALRRSVGDYYARANTAEGIPAKDLLDELVRNTLAADASQARREVMSGRLRDFEREYQHLAPLGSTLGRLRRDIDLAEKTYLAALASLSSSESAAQNVGLANSLRVVDPPNLPTAPKSNYLLLLTLGAGLAGLLLTAGGVLALGLLDGSLRDAARAARRTGLAVAGALPDPRAAPALAQRHTEQVVQHLLLKANLRAPGTGPLLVAVTSLHTQPATATLTEALAAGAHALGLPVLALYAGTAPAGPAPHLGYAVQAAAVQGSTVAQLAAPTPGAAAALAAARLVLVELPALRDAALPAGILRELGLVLLAVPAAHTWQFPDRQTLRELRTATAAPVELVLLDAMPGVLRV